MDAVAHLRAWGDFRTNSSATVTFLDEATRPLLKDVHAPRVSREYLERLQTRDRLLRIL
jgi:hypothetical protein